MVIGMQEITFFLLSTCVQHVSSYCILLSQSKLPVAKWIGEYFIEMCSVTPSSVPGKNKANPDILIFCVF